MSFEAKHVYGPLPDTNRGRRCDIAGDPKGENMLYCSGTSVVIRNVRNPLLCELYTEHQRPPTVARYAPSGYYIASGDSSGVVRIWDTTQKEHPLKIELPVLGSTIYDLAWSEDSKRIVVGGDGRETYGRAFLWDSGSSVGQIDGHAKAIYSIDFKPSRPYRVVTGSEDFACHFYHGPPFKYKGAMKEHKRFVHCVRFAPDGNTFISVGADKKGILYEGKTGEKKGELSSENAHTGGIYCCSWSPDGSQILTASADRSCKIWDANTGQCVTTFPFPSKAVEHQQLGCLWQGEFLLSVDLNGRITYLDPSNPETPIQVLLGHKKFVTAMALDRDSNTVYSGSYDHTMCKWDMDTGKTSAFSGEGHSNSIVDAEVRDGKLVTAGMDDSIRITDVGSMEFSADGRIATDSPVADVATGEGGLVVGVSMKSIYVIRNSAQVANLPVGYSPKSVAISPDSNTVAVGAEDSNIYLYTLAGDSLQEKGRLEGHRDHVLALDFSNDGAYLVSGGKDRYVHVWDANTLEHKIKTWAFHTARVQSVAFHPDCAHVVSGSLDQNIYIWDVNVPNKKIAIKNAHHLGVNKVTWQDGSTILSCGQDHVLKTHTIEF